MIFRSTYWQKLLSLTNVVCFIFLVSISAATANPAAIDWLQTNSSPTGDISTPSDIANAYQATMETMRAFNVLNVTPQHGTANALQYINSESYHSTEYLARKIIVNHLYGNDTSTYVTELRGMQNWDGGYGELHNYDSTVIDTAFALETFASINDATSSNIPGAIAYLLNQQKGDGGWTDGINESSVYTTAVVIRALAAYKASYSGVANALSAAQSFLLFQQVGSLWGADFESATALLALTSVMSDISVLTPNYEALQERQLLDGSWSGDVFSTALALQAIALFEARKGTPNAGASTAGITGSVVKAGSGEPISGAIVSLAEQPGTKVTTSATGTFSLTGIQSATYTLVVQKQGYQGISTVVNAVAGQLTNVGQLVLGLSPQTGIVRGSIYDSESQIGLAEVIVSLIGSQSYSTTSDVSGYFELSDLPPGSYSLSISKLGYNTISGSAEVVAGQVLQLNQGMIQEGLFLDDSPANLKGQIIDGNTGLPITGALFALDNGQSALTDANGSFIISSVARGEYTAIASATGYVETNYNIIFAPGNSGNLGVLSLYAAEVVQSPTTLTLHGAVLDGLNSQPISGASISVIETGELLSSDLNGKFTLADITLQSLQLTISAPNYETRTFTITVNTFGEVSAEFVLPPFVPADPTVTSSTLNGTVVDQDTKLPIADATVSIVGTEFSAITDTAGHYYISGVDQLVFDVLVTALGYQQAGVHAELNVHGNYTLDYELSAQTTDPAAPDIFQVLSVTPQQSEVSGNQTILVDSSIGNLTDTEQTGLITGEIVNSDGVSIATLTPFVPGTTTLQSEFVFNPTEILDLQLPWDVAQNAAGTYQIIVRVIEPGSISQSLPTGKVLAEGTASITVKETRAIDGGTLFDPPLTQAGSSIPVSLSALIINKSNVPLLNTSYNLVISDPDTNTVLHTSTAQLEQINVSQNATLSFGNWLPTQFGNLNVQVQPTDSTIDGVIIGNLYVGDKASGSFTVDKHVVPEGTQNVQATISLQGVDIKTGTSTDPLFLAVKNSVEKGGNFVGTEGVNWHNRNRCLGCHIQTQSQMGLASSLNKADINESQTKFLHNTLTSSQQSNGGIYLSHPYYGKTQTSLALWSLRSWPDKAQTYRTMYHAARYMHDRRVRSGAQTYWRQDHNTGYVRNYSNITALVTMGYADVIHSSETLDLGVVRGYSLQPGQPLNSPTRPIDMEVGPDGHLYIVKLSGAVDRVDKDTKEVTTVVAGLPNNSYGLAIEANGTMYVSGYQFLIRVNPDGSKDTLLTSSGYLTDVELGSDGLLYVADHSNHRILRVTTSGQSEVLSASSLYRNPYGLAFDSNDNLLIANNAYNILKLSPNNTLSVFASGISFRILWLDVDADNQVYASSYNPNGLYRINPAGVAERILAHSDGLRGIAIDKSTGQVFVSNDTRNTYHELTIGGVTQALLNEYKSELPRMVRYFLNRYQDNNNDNTIHALRMSALAEARRVITDSSLLSEIDNAITYEENLLRNRQRSDGGWGRYSTWGSDPLVTAMVGMALDYTNPSADDPMVRNTIQYLLNTQRGDGSWNNNNSLFSTRLAATSFVMAYMPKALERLGGIDVDLHLSLPENVQISNLSTPETSTSLNSIGGIDYFWSLQGVTSNTRVIDFDMTLQDMFLGEERAVATNAYMTFENSFTNEQLQVDLNVPVVKAASELLLGLTTDKTVYYANENVHITSIVDNTSPVIVSGTVQLAIHAQGSSEPIAVLPLLPVENLSAGGHISLPAEWNTGSQYIGSYEVVGKLFDEQNRVLREQSTPFSIMHMGTAISSSITTDKPVYEGWDSVQINSRVRNISANVIQLPSVAIISVLTPAGDELLSALVNLSELIPGSYRNFAEQLNLVEAATGEYIAKLFVYDAATRKLLHTSQTTFQVEQTQAQAVKGTVLASPNRIELGDAVVCENTVTNISSVSVTDLTIIQRVASIATGEILEEQRTVENLEEKSDIIKLHSIGTTGFELGGYACLLSAEIDNTEIQLAAAGFEVIEPPIKIETVFETQGRGRLLVLLDSNKHTDKDDDDKYDDDKYEDDKYDRDPHGPKGAPTLTQQRDYLEGQLNAAGWSYTIVTDEDAFAREMRSNGYVAYALFNEHEKLDKQVQQELRERVHRGEGLLVAGSHDERNKYLNDALGIKHKGKQGKTTDFTYLDSVLELTGNQTLAYKDKVRRIELKGAEVVAEFNIVDKYDDKHDDDNDKKNTKGHHDKDDSGDDDDDNYKYSKAAVTTYQFGLGRSVYAGFDLLAHATALQDDNLLDDLLNLGLGHVHPVDMNIIPTKVVPLTVVLTNKGIATPGRVVITMPDNVQIVDPSGTALGEQGEVILPFDLAEDAVAVSSFWVRLPDVTTSLEFNASVQTGIMPDYIEYEVISLSITLTIFPGMADAITELSTISSSSKYYKKALKYLHKAEKSLHENKIKYVVKNLIKATDNLAKVKDEAATDIRVMIDHDIARYAAMLPTGKHDDDDDD